MADDEKTSAEAEEKARAAERAREAFSTMQREMVEKAVTPKQRERAEQPAHSEATNAGEAPGPIYAPKFNPEAIPTTYEIEGEQPSSTRTHERVLQQSLSKKQKYGISADAPSVSLVAGVDPWTAAAAQALSDAPRHAAWGLDRLQNLDFFRRELAQGLLAAGEYLPDPDTWAGDALSSAAARLVSELPLPSSLSKADAGAEEGRDERTKERIRKMTEYAYGRIATGEAKAQVEKTSIEPPLDIDRGTVPAPPSYNTVGGTDFLTPDGKLKPAGAILETMLGQKREADDSWRPAYGYKHILDSLVSPEDAAAVAASATNEADRQFFGALATENGRAWLGLGLDILVDPLNLLGPVAGSKLVALGGDFVRLAPDVVRSAGALEHVAGLRPEEAAKIIIKAARGDESAAEVVRRAAAHAEATSERLAQARAAAGGEVWQAGRTVDSGMAELADADALRAIMPLLDDAPATAPLIDSAKAALASGDAERIRRAAKGAKIILDGNARAYAELAIDLRTAVARAKAGGGLADRGRNVGRMAAHLPFGSKTYYPLRGVGVGIEKVAGAASARLGAYIPDVKALAARVNLKGLSSITEGEKFALAFSKVANLATGIPLALWDGFARSMVGRALQPFTINLLQVSAARKADLAAMVGDPIVGQINRIKQVSPELWESYQRAANDYINRKQALTSRLEHEIQGWTVEARKVARARNRAKVGGREDWTTNEIIAEAVGHRERGSGQLEADPELDALRAQMQGLVDAFVENNPGADGRMVVQAAQSLVRGLAEGRRGDPGRFAEELEYLLQDPTFRGFAEQVGGGNALTGVNGDNLLRTVALWRKAAEATAAVTNEVDPVRMSQALVDGMVALGAKRLSEDDGADLLKRLLSDAVKGAGMSLPEAYRAIRTATGADRIDDAFRAMWAQALAISPDGRLPDRTAVEQALHALSVKAQEDLAIAERVLAGGGVGPPEVARVLGAAAVRDLARARALVPQLEWAKLRALALDPQGEQALTLVLQADGHTPAQAKSLATRTLKAARNGIQAGETAAAAARATAAGWDSSAGAVTTGHVLAAAMVESAKRAGNSLPPGAMRARLQAAVDAGAARARGERPAGRHPFDNAPDQVGPLHRTMTLDEAEQAIRTDPIEHAAVFDPDGRQVWRGSGDAHSVNLGGAPIPPRSTITHNHPNNSGHEVWSPLSAPDIMLAVANDLEEVRAVQTYANGPPIVWRARRPPGGWPSLTAQNLDDDFKAAVANSAAVLSARGVDISVPNWHTTLSEEDAHELWHAFTESWRDALRARGIEITRSSLHPRRPLVGMAAQHGGAGGAHPAGSLAPAGASSSGWDAGAATAARVEAKEAKSVEDLFFGVGGAENPFIPREADELAAGKVEPIAPRAARAKMAPASPASPSHAEVGDAIINAVGESAHGKAGFVSFVDRALAGAPEHARAGMRLILNSLPDEWYEGLRVRAGARSGDWLGLYEKGERLSRVSVAARAGDVRTFIQVLCHEIGHHLLEHSPHSQVVRLMDAFMAAAGDSREALLADNFFASVRGGTPYGRAADWSYSDVGSAGWRGRMFEEWVAENIAIGLMETPKLDWFHTAVRWVKQTLFRMDEDDIAEQVVHPDVKAFIKRITDGDLARADEVVEITRHYFDTPSGMVPAWSPQDFNKEAFVTKWVVQEFQRSMAYPAAPPVTPDEFHRILQNAQRLADPSAADKIKEAWDLDIPIPMPDGAVRVPHVSEVILYSDYATIADALRGKAPDEVQAIATEAFRKVQRHGMPWNSDALQVSWTNAPQPWMSPRATAPVAARDRIISLKELELVAPLLRAAQGESPERVIAATLAMLKDEAWLPKDVPGYEQLIRVYPSLVGQRYGELPEELAPLVERMKATVEFYEKLYKETGVVNPAPQVDLLARWGVVNYFPHMPTKSGKTAHELASMVTAEANGYRTVGDGSLDNLFTTETDASRKRVLAGTIDEINAAYLAEDAARIGEFTVDPLRVVAHYTAANRAVTSVEFLYQLLHSGVLRRFDDVGGVPGEIAARDLGYVPLLARPHLKVGWDVYMYANAEELRAAGVSPADVREALGQIRALRMAKFAPWAAQAAPLENAARVEEAILELRLSALERGEAPFGLRTITSSLPTWSPKTAPAWDAAAEDLARALGDRMQRKITGRDLAGFAAKDQGMSAMYLPASVAQSMLDTFDSGRWSSLFDEREVLRAGKNVLDRTTNFFKTRYTIIRLPFHVANLVSNELSSTMRSFGYALGFRTQVMAARLTAAHGLANRYGTLEAARSAIFDTKQGTWYSRGERLMVDAAARAKDAAMWRGNNLDALLEEGVDLGDGVLRTADEALSLMRNHNVSGDAYTTFADLHVFQEELLGALATGNFDGLKRLLTQGASVAEDVALVSAGAVGAFGFPVILPKFIGRDVASWIENRSRIANFMHYLGETGSVTRAADEVQATLFNYADLTGFQKVIVRSAWPFFTWTWKNLELQAKLFAEKPWLYHWYEELLVDSLPTLLQDEQDRRHGRVPDNLGPWANPELIDARSSSKAILPIPKLDNAAMVSLRTGPEAAMDIIGQGVAVADWLAADADDLYIEDIRNDAARILANGQPVALMLAQSALDRNFYYGGELDDPENQRRISYQAAELLNGFDEVISLGTPAISPIAAIMKAQIADYLQFASVDGQPRVNPQRAHYFFASPYGPAMANLAGASAVVWEDTVISRSRAGAEEVPYVYSLLAMSGLGGIKRLDVAGRNERLKRLQAQRVQEWWAKHRVARETEVHSAPKQ